MAFDEVRDMHIIITRLADWRRAAEFKWAIEAGS